MNSFSKSSQWEAFYGSVRLQPSLYQDDIGRMVSNLLAAQAGNTFLSTMMESKLLNFNVLKSVFLVVGNCEETEKIKEQVTEKPLMLSGKIMKNVVQYDYLGMVVHEGGAGASAAATVNKRVGRVKQLIFEIKAVLEDCRLETVGGLISGLDSWEMMVLPYLYFSSECWTDISKETLKKLTDLHLLFYRSLLASGRGAPIGGLFWFLGQLLPENLLMQKKLLFLFHLANLPSDAIARKIYEEQRRLKFEGLVSDCRLYLAELNIRESLVTVSSKSEWRSLVRERISLKNRKDILEMCEEYRKLDYFELKNENFKCKEFFKNMKLLVCRTYFSIRTNMSRHAKPNFASDPEFSKQLWKCDNSNIKQMSYTLHVRYCDSYKHLRTGKDFSDHKILIKYFQEVQKLCDEKEKNHE